jgi:hypothetical protein
MAHYQPTATSLMKGTKIAMAYFNVLLCHSLQRLRKQ